MASPSGPRRPRAVTVAAWLHIVEGIAMFPVGLLVGTSGVLPVVYDELLLTPEERIELVVLGVLFAAVGLICLITAYGLFRMRPWAWLLAMMVQGVNLALSLWARFNGTPEYVSMALSVLLVLVLNQAEVRDAFARQSEELHG